MLALPYLALTAAGESQSASSASRYHASSDSLASWYFSQKS